MSAMGDCELSAGRGLPDQLAWARADRGETGWSRWGQSDRSAPVFRKLLHGCAYDGAILPIGARVRRSMAGRRLARALLDGLTGDVTGHLLVAVGAAVAVMAQIQLGPRWICMPPQDGSEPLVEDGLDAASRNPGYIGQAIFAVGLFLHLPVLASSSPRWFCSSTPHPGDGGRAHLRHGLPDVWEAMPPSSGAGSAAAGTAQHRLERSFCCNPFATSLTPLPGRAFLLLRTNCS